MKGLFYLVVFLILFSCKENTTSGKETTRADKTSTDTKSQDHPTGIVGELKSIEDIQKEYSYITYKIANGGVDSTSFKYNCNQEKIGEVTYFSEEGQLRKIKHTYNEYSHFSGTEEYFIKDNDLFFVYYDHTAWSFVNQNQTRDDVTEKRYYIIDNQPVKCLQKKFEIFSNAKDSIKPSMVPNQEIACSSMESILEDFELFLKLRNQKDDLICLEK